MRLPTPTAPTTARTPLTSYAVTDPRQDPRPGPGRPDYPPAQRLDLVEELHGIRGRRPVPLAGGRRPTRDRGVVARPQDDAVRASRWTPWPARDRLRDAADRAARAPAACRAPIWRGDRCLLHAPRRRPGARGRCWSVDADGTERVLIDPIAIDPSGTTTLDGWQPSQRGRPARLPAVRGRRRGVRALRHGRRHRRARRRPDRPRRYSPVAWLPGGEAFYYVRRLAADEVPAGEEQFHRRVWLHRVGTDPDTDVDGRSARASTTTNYYGVLGLPRRPLAAGLRVRGHRAAQRRLDRRPDRRRRAPARPVQEGVDAQHVGRGSARDGRLYLLTDLDAPRGRLVRGRPDRPRVEDWRDLVPEDPDGGARRTSRSSTAPALATGRAAGVVDPARGRPRSPCTTLATGEPGGQVDRCPALGIGRRHRRAPRGRPRGLVRLHRPHDAVHGAALRRAATGRGRRCGRPRRAPSTSPVVHAEQVTYRLGGRHEVQHVRASPRAARRPDRGRGRRSSTATAASTSRSTPATPRRSLAWVEAGGVYAVAEPARRRRGGRGVAPRRHARAQAERVRRLPRRGGVADRRRLDHARSSWPSSAARNGGLLVGAALTQRPELFAAVVCSRAAARHGPLRAVRPRRDLERRVRHGRRTRASSAGCSAYSPYHHVRDGTDYPAVLFTVFDGDTRVDPLHARKMCAALQHATAGERPVLLRREQDVGHGARSVSRIVSLSVDRAGLPRRATGTAAVSATQDAVDSGRSFGDVRRRQPRCDHRQADPTSS